MLAWITSIDPEGALNFVSGAMQSQIAQYVTAFSIAAWIHSGRMKKEIALQVGGIKEALQDLGAALREDLKRQSERIEKLEKEVYKP